MNGVLPSLTWGTWDDADFARYRGPESSTGAETSPADQEHGGDAAARSSASQSAKSRRKLEKKGLRAPVDSRQWFQELQERVDASPFGGDGCVYSCNPLSCSHSTCEEQKSTVIPWEELPEGIHPRDGKLPPRRARNKRLQVENLAVFLRRMLRYGVVCDVGVWVLVLLTSVYCYCILLG